MTYGSNYTHFAPPTAPTGQLGVVHEYHLHRPLAQQQLAEMRAAGLTDLRIPMYILAAEELGGLEDGFTLKLYGSSFDAQRQQNLVNLIADARAAGFTWISLGPGAAGNILGPSNWTAFDEAAWERWGGFVNWCHSLPVDVVDLGEVIGFGSVVTQWAQRTWAWATAGWGNAAVTIGLTSGVQNVDAALSVYKGSDQTGPVDWPAEIGLHLYGPVPFPGHGSFYSIGSLMIAELLALGMPLVTKISIHERTDFSDVVTNAEQARLIADYSQVNWTRSLQWPMVLGGGQFAMSPPVRGYPN